MKARIVQFDDATEAKLGKLMIAWDLDAMGVIKKLVADAQVGQGAKVVPVRDPAYWKNPDWQRKVDGVTRGATAGKGQADVAEKRSRPAPVDVVALQILSEQAQVAIARAKKSLRKTNL